MFPGLEPWIDKLPDYFCSELPDVFMASVYVIDILLSDASPDAALRGVVATDDREARETRSDPLQQLGNVDIGADGAAARKLRMASMPHDDHDKLWWVAELLKRICEEAVDDGNGFSSFPYMDRKSVDYLIGKLYVALDWNNSVISDLDSRKIRNRAPGPREIRNSALRDVLTETHKPLGQILRALRNGLKTGIPIQGSLVDKAHRARLLLLECWHQGRKLPVGADLANHKEGTTHPPATAEQSSFALSADDTVHTINKMLSNDPGWAWKKVKRWLLDQNVNMYTRKDWQARFHSAPQKIKGQPTLTNQGELLEAISRVLAEQNKVDDTAFETMEAVQDASHKRPGQ